MYKPLSGFSLGPSPPRHNHKRVHDFIAIRETAFIAWVRLARVRHTAATTAPQGHASTHELEWPLPVACYTRPRQENTDKSGMRDKKRTRSRAARAESKPNGLPIEGSLEFQAKPSDALHKLCRKYAWIADQSGYVLRANPLKIQPYQQWVFNRISNATYGFAYRTKDGHTKRWKPQNEIDDTFVRDYEPEYIEGDYVDDPFIIAERLEFLPGQPELTNDVDGCRVLNLWHPSPWKVRDDLQAPAPLLDHVRYLLDDNSEAVEHTLDFIAHLVQRPHERVAHALLLTSEAKGIGKSSLGKVIRSLVGERNSRVAQTKDLKGQFDGWIVGKLVVQVDEVYEAGNWDLANKLKPLITEPRVSVNVKYGPQMEIENYARLVLFEPRSAHQH